MSPETLKVEPSCPDQRDRTPPPVDQELWKRYIYEHDSDSDASGIEPEEQMAGPVNVAKSTKPDAPQLKQTSKYDLAKEVLDESFNDMIFSILEGRPVEAAATNTDGGESKTQEGSDTWEKAKETPAGDGKRETSQASELNTGKETTSATEDKPSKAKDTGSQPKDPKAIADLEICQNCNLPRLKYPRIGLTSRPLPDPNAQYCANEPPIVLAGHDVHGNAFPGFKPKPNTNTAVAAAAAAAASASKSTKPKPNTSNNNKADKKAPSSAAATADATSPTNSQDSPSSSENTAATPSGSFEYPQIRTPQMKCPNCGQWKAVNVMAKHLDICLLGKGRRAGREARERIGAGTGTGTPGEGSRAGTPKPGGGSGGGAGGLKRGRLEDGGAGGETARSGKKQKRGKEKDKDKDKEKE